MSFTWMPWFEEHPLLSFLEKNSGSDLGHTWAPSANRGARSSHFLISREGDRDGFLNVNCSFYHKGKPTILMLLLIKKITNIFIYATSLFAKEMIFSDAFIQ